jgi:hypothetical protein
MNKRLKFRLIKKKKSVHQLIMKGKNTWKSKSLYALTQWINFRYKSFQSQLLIQTSNNLNKASRIKLDLLKKQGRNLRLSKKTMLTWWGNNSHRCKPFRNVRKNLNKMSKK